MGQHIVVAVPWVRLHVPRVTRVQGRAILFAHRKVFFEESREEVMRVVFVQCGRACDSKGVEGGLRVG